MQFSILFGQNLVYYHFYKNAPGICHTILICVKLVFIFDICSSVTHSIKFAFAIHAECNNFSTVSLYEIQISLKGAFEWINIPGRVPPWQSCKIPQNMIKLYQIPAPTEIPLNLWPCWAENTKKEGLKKQKLYRMSTLRLPDFTLKSKNLFYQTSNWGLILFTRRLYLCIKSVFFL